MEQLDTVTEDWAAQMLAASIYLNDKKSITPPPLRELPSRCILPEMIEAPALPVAVRGKTTADKVLNFLLTKSIRRGSIELIWPHIELIRAKVAKAVENDQPVSLVMPSLPFKDQSPFGTGAPIDHVDLGEHSTFAQFKRVIQGVQQIYEPGLHMTLLCDGLIYADLFTDNDLEGAGRYKAACEAIKNNYGLYNDITLVDMREVLFRVPYWKRLNSRIKGIVCELYNSDPMAKRRLDYLASRFIFHVKQANYTYESAREYFENRHEWAPEMQEKLLAAAIGYCAVHLTMKHTDVVNQAFPSAIRATVHPKSAPQLPLHMSNRHCSLLPYNGVPLVSRQAIKNGQSLFKAVRIKRLCDVMSCPEAVAVHREGSRHPFYYEVS